MSKKYIMDKKKEGPVIDPSLELVNCITVN